MDKSSVRKIAPTSGWTTGSRSNPDTTRAPTSGWTTGSRSNPDTTRAPTSGWTTGSRSNPDTTRAPTSGWTTGQASSLHSRDVTYPSIGSKQSRKEANIISHIATIRTAYIKKLNGILSPSYGGTFSEHLSKSLEDEIEYLNDKNAENAEHADKLTGKKRSYPEDEEELDVLGMPVMREYE